MFAIISDIHGNLEALRAVLAEGERLGVDEWFCLGDVVGYGANPNECLDCVRERCEVVLKGNHDEAAVQDDPATSFNPWAAEAVLWTRQTLTDESRRYLWTRPLIHENDLATFVHATPIAPRLWHYVLNDVDAQANATGFSTPLCFVGHSHHAGAYTIREENGAPFRYLVNVGSVGQPRDGDRRACMVVARDREGGHDVEFVRVEYDIATAQRKIIKAGLPEVLAERLALGL